MRNIIWLVLLFAAAVVAALALGDNNGLASFYWGGWRLDLSLNFFLLASLALLVLAVVVVQGLRALLRMPERARSWRDLRRERAVQAALREALAEFFAGRYSRANKAAQRAALAPDDLTVFKGETDFRQLAQLLAAASLHRLQDRTQRDALLREALRPGREGAANAADDGARLLAAEWALDDRDAGRAQALLAELPPGVGRRTQALRLRLQAQRLARQPLEALHTARLLSKHQAFSRLAAQGLLRSLAFGAMDDAHDIEQLRRVWQQLDPADQRDAFVVARAARLAGGMGKAEEARAWLRPLFEQLATLEPDARSEVALALVDVVSGIGSDWLPRLETAQRTMVSDPAVQAAVGAVYAERQLWGLARRPLEFAANDGQLPARARRQAWRALARLATEEGDEPRAQACYQAAAALD